MSGTGYQETLFVQKSMGLLRLRPTLPSSLLLNKGKLIVTVTEKSTLDRQRHRSGASMQGSVGSRQADLAFLRASWEAWNWSVARSVHMKTYGSHHLVVIATILTLFDERSHVSAGVKLWCPLDRYPSGFGRFHHKRVFIWKSSISKTP